MGITRGKLHKRRGTGGKRPVDRKKRKHELGRQPAMTKLVSGGVGKRVRLVRCRGGNIKHRALRLDSGNYSWGSEAVTRKTRVLDVVYNASNNELVRTKTITKNTIVQIDATPFKAWYKQHYGELLGKKDNETEEEVKQSKHVVRKIAARNANHALDKAFEDQFKAGRILAAVSSRPGQSGRADGYLLEGKELEFYLKKLHKKKGASSK